MAEKSTGFRSAKSIAGAALAGVGIFILYQDLAPGIVRLSRFLGADGTNVLEFPAVVMQSVSQYLLACGDDRGEMFRCFGHHVLVFLWPLFLVMTGTVLPRHSWSGSPMASRKKVADMSIRGAAVRCRNRGPFPQPHKEKQQ